MFKNSIIFGLLCLVAVLALDVRPAHKAINEALYRGTLRGAETCVSYSGSELLSKDSIQATCVQSFQKRLFSEDHASGQAGPRFDQEKIQWGGVLENKSPDHVTTWVEIAVKVFDKDGTEKEFTGETPVWINPLSKAEFQVELPDLERELVNDVQFCDRDEEAPKACMGWGVVDIMGLEM